jgi:ubiquinone/menaquinone biosynthesis C-methylase UbiE
MSITENYIRAYLSSRPLFLSVLRGFEAGLYQSHKPFKKPILDIGCGDGFFASVTFGKGSIDVGVDMEESRIGEARETGVYKKLVTYDGLTLPFADKSFKTIVINSVLEHVSALPKVLSESRRVLAPGGTCMTTVMALPWEKHLFGAKIIGKRYADWMRKKQVHTNLLSIQEWKRAFKKAGFTIDIAYPYMSPTAASWLDIFHYLSVPNLISYTLTKRWVLFPLTAASYPTAWLASLMEESVDDNNAGAVFFVLKRS